MPTYEYRCKKCGKTFEKLQSMKDSPVKSCPCLPAGRRVRCGGRVERLIGSGVGLIFKGSGFYQTDYKKSSGSDKKTETKAKETPAKPDKPDKKPDSK